MSVDWITEVPCTPDGPKLGEDVKVGMTEETSE